MVLGFCHGNVIALKRFATMEAHKLVRKRSGYSPTPGAEHCPACWARSGATLPLRWEWHHNGDEEGAWRFALYAEPFIPI